MQVLHDIADPFFRRLVHVLDAQLGRSQQFDDLLFYWRQFFDIYGLSPLTCRRILYVILCFQLFRFVPFGVVVDSILARLLWNGCLSIR